MAGRSIDGRSTVRAMTIDVRTVTEEDFAPWVDAVATGFLMQPAEGDAEIRRAAVEIDRVWAAFDGDRVVGTLRSWASELTVPGGAFVSAAALTNVTVQATHRRQGLLTRMMEPDLRDAADRGEVVGMLIAAEWPIYGRYGYGPAAESAMLTIDAASARFAGESPPGSVALADLAEVRKVGPTLYERFRPQQPGSITRPERWWDRSCRVVVAPSDEPFKGFVVVSRDETGEPDGYVIYTVDSQWEHNRPASVLTVESLVSATPAAYERLWRYCCSLDWVATVKAEDRSTAELLPWLLTNPRVVAPSRRTDFQWVRPFDVAALLSARTYLAPGRVVLDVIDPQGYATGRFVVEGGPDGATCAPTSEPAGLTVPAGTLGAMALGGHSLHQLAAARFLDVHDHRALATAEAMFRGAVTPWCSTWF